MRRLIVKTGCLVAFAAMGMGCGARDEARGDETAEQATTATVDEPATASAAAAAITTTPASAALAIGVPALVCTSANEYGVPEWTLRTTAGDVTGGASLRRYSILDGQSYVVAYYTVGATREENALGDYERVLADGNGAFELRIDDAGNALGHAQTPIGFTFDLALTCTEVASPAAPSAPSPSGNGRGKGRNK